MRSPPWFDLPMACLAALVSGTLVAWVNSEYGLAATVWTSNLQRAHRVAPKMETGIVWVNTWYLRDLRTPFGGVKLSGIGREGGEHSLNFYAEPMNICINLD